MPTFSIGFFVKPGEYFSRIATASGFSISSFRVLFNVIALCNTSFIHLYLK